MVTELSRRRVPAPERREQILAAARDLFVEQGVVSASMRAIAARVGITPTAIYDHFKDKEALLAAIAIGFFGDLVDAIAAAIAPEKTPEGRFKAMGRAYVKFGLHHPQEYRLLFMSPSARLRRPSERVDPMTDAYRMLEDAVAALMEAGFIRKSERKNRVRWPKPRGPWFTASSPCGSRTRRSTSPIWTTSSKPRSPCIWTR